MPLDERHCNMIQCHNLNEWKINRWKYTFPSECKIYTTRQTFSFRNNMVHMLVHSLDYYCLIDFLELQGDISFLYFLFFSYSFFGVWYAVLMMSSLFRISKIHGKRSKFYVQGRHSRGFLLCAARMASCSYAWIISAAPVSPEIKIGCKRQKKVHALLLYQTANRVLLIWKTVDEAFYTRMVPLR